MSGLDLGDLPTAAAAGKPKRAGAPKALSPRKPAPTPAAAAAPALPPENGGMTDDELASWHRRQASVLRSEADEIVLRATAAADIKRTGALRHEALARAVEARISPDRGTGK